MLQSPHERQLEVLDLARREQRVHGLHERDDAGNMRARHRGADDRLVREVIRTIDGEDRVGGVIVAEAVATRRYDVDALVEVRVRGEGKRRARRRLDDAGAVGG